MREDLFQELTQSLREAKAIRLTPRAGIESCVSGFRAQEAPDVVTIRERYKLSQEKFAALLGISIHTLRNWEQGKRTPEGPARVSPTGCSEAPGSVAHDTVRAA